MRAAVTLAVVITSLLGLVGCDAPPPAAETPPPEVIVAVAAEQGVNPYRRFVGRVTAVEDTAIVARVPGYIVERSFTEGSDVAAGDLLFTLDPEEFQIAVANAEAVLKQAQAEFAAAEGDFKRADELTKAEAIAARDFDEAVNRRDQAAATVAGAEAALDRARYDLRYTEVRAPIAGRVSMADKSVGDFVNVNEVLTTVVTTDPMYVTFDVNEKQLAELTLKRATREERRAAMEGVEVSLLLPGGRPYETVGKIDFFDNRINPRTGSIKVRAVVANPGLVLVAGQFVTVIVENESPVEAILVPQSSIQQDQRGVYLMVVNEAGVVDQRRVELGDRFDGDVVVTTGLEPGEQVVVEGLLKIRPGMTVATSEQAPALDPADPGAADAGPAEPEDEEPAAADGTGEER